MWGMKLSWWQHLYVVPTLIIALMWRTPLFWLAVLALIGLGYGGCQIGLHLRLGWN